MVPFEGIHTGESLQDVAKTSEGVDEGAKEQEIIPQDIQNILQDTSIWDSSKGDQQKAFQDFQNFIKNNPDNKEIIFQHLRQIDVNTLGDYVYENGYIINQDTLLAFQEKFQITNLQKSISSETETTEAQTETTEAQTETTEAQTETTDTQIETTDAQKQQIDSFHNIFQNQVGNLASVPDADKTLKLVKEAQADLQKTPEAIQAIETFFQNLENKPEAFQQVAQTFYNESPAAYEEYKSYALSVNPNLHTQFESFQPEGKSITDLTEVHEAQVLAGLGTTNPDDIKSFGNYKETTSPDGQVTRMNISEVPPSRTIGLEGSNLRIPTDVPIGDLYPAIAQEGLAYEKVSAENMPKISRLKALESSQVQDFLTGEEFQKESLANCIRIISTLIGLPSDMKLSDLIGKEIYSKEELVSALSQSSIFSRKQELEKEVDDKKIAYQKALATHMQDYSDAIRERDEVAKKALQICKNAGFDLLDIDYILSQLSGSQVPNIGVSFDKKNIDIATLNFGQPNGEAANESNFAQRIYRTMNMILFQNPNGTDAHGDQVGFDLSAIARAPQGQLKTPNEIRNLLETQGILNPTTGIMNKELVMRRFTQGVKTNKAQ